MTYGQFSKVGDYTSGTFVHFSLQKLINKFINDNKGKTSAEFNETLTLFRSKYLNMRNGSRIQQECSSCLKELSDFCADVKIYCGEYAKHFSNLSKKNKQN